MCAAKNVWHRVKKWNEENCYGVWLALFASLAKWSHRKRKHINMSLFSLDVMRERAGAVLSAPNTYTHKTEND